MQFLKQINWTVFTSWCLTSLHCYKLICQHSWE